MTHMAATAMAFSEDGRYVLVYFEPKHTDASVEVDRRDGTYILWDINSNTGIGSKQWGSFELKLEAIRFPVHVYGMYHYLDSEYSISRRDQ